MCHRIKNKNAKLIPIPLTIVAVELLDGWPSRWQINKRHSFEEEKIHIPAHENKQALIRKFPNIILSFWLCGQTHPGSNLPIFCHFSATEGSCVCVSRHVC